MRDDVLQKLKRLEDREPFQATQGASGIDFSEYLLNPLCSLREFEEFDEMLHGSKPERQKFVSKSFSI